MAILNIQNIILGNNQIDWDKQEHIQHAEYYVESHNGHRYVHIQTFGSENRVTPPKPSQDLVIEIEALIRFCDNI